MPADLLFTNGVVLTMDARQPAAEAVAVVGDRIARVGSHDDLAAEMGPAARVVDLGGRALIPGFNDNHTHPIFFGQSLRTIDARPDAIATLAELQVAFRAAAARPANGSGDWLLARGYDDSRLDIGRHPTRHDLDAATGGRPAMLTRTCGHLAVVNSAALSLAGITAATSDPSGGQIDRDAHGEPTGVLRENAMNAIRALLPPPTRSQIKADLRAAGERFLAYGITSVGEAAIKTSDELAAYQELAAAGELPMRVFTMMLIDDTLDALARLGMRTGFGDAWLRIGPAKLFQDGSGGGRTAAMFADYRNDPGNRGITIYDQPGLNERFARAHAAGFQLTAHAIGDRAITMILDAFEAALTAAPKADHRFRIEHCGLCTAEILDRMARLRIVAVPQPSFIYELGDSYLKNFTEEQLALSYPGRAWFDRDIVAIGSSDVPVVSCDPFVNLRSAVTRRTRDGQRMGPGQGVTIDEALRMFTCNGAYGSFEESIKGSITPGKLADLAVLSADPRGIDPEQLHTLRADMTVIGGRVAYEA
ncbi:MAG: amidohydrolase [Thermomicrobiales bacterium]|nr:amidohydrolase [Thermomicrobiales bacterium]